MNKYKTDDTGVVLHYEPIGSILIQKNAKIIAALPDEQRILIEIEGSNDNPICIFQEENDYWDFCPDDKTYYRMQAEGRLG